MPYILNTDEKIKKAIYKVTDYLYPDHRYSSFDYCYGYFSGFKNKKEIASDKYLQISCLQLASYLASWGMYRGSSFLLKEKSSRYFMGLIKWISKCPKSYWEIDVNTYDDETVKELCDIYNRIVEHLDLNKKRHIVLSTKIMLGVFGNTPAYDQYFTDTFRKYFGRPAFRSYNEKSLLALKEFYDDNSRLIERERKKNKITNFINGKETNKLYTRAKLIDMIGFGYKK